MTTEIVVRQFDVTDRKGNKHTVYGADLETTASRFVQVLDSRRAVVGIWPASVVRSAEEVLYTHTITRPPAPDARGFLVTLRDGTFAIVHAAAVVIAPGRFIKLVDSQGTLCKTWAAGEVHSVLDCHAAPQAMARTMRREAVVPAW